MSKRVGLPQEDEKYFEVIPFPKDFRSCAALLYSQAKSFFYLFALAFGDGSKKVQSYNNESKTFSDHTIANTENLPACLVNYHFAVEMMLKSLICLKEAPLEKFLFTHELTILLKKAHSLYPELLSKIAANPNYMLILEKLSTSFSKIRYAEGLIFLSHNKGTGWENKKPLQELSEMLYAIFHILCEIFEEARMPPKQESSQ